MSNADLIQFDAYINRGNTNVAYIMSNVMDTALVDFKQDFVAYIDQADQLVGYINQSVNDEVEL